MPARRAVCIIRENIACRHDSFVAGLAAAGFRVCKEIPDPRPGDLLVTWNRHGSSDAVANRFEEARASVLVAENGFYRIPDETGWQHYSISKGQHHFGGAPVIEASVSRLPKPLPWRPAGEHIVVCDQRGIGSKFMASPKGWGEFMADWLRRATDRPVVLRKHPRVAKEQTPLIADLEGAHSCVVWSSCAGVEALLAGIPVFYAAPRWIGQDAAWPLTVKNIENPYLADRTRALATVASNMWSLAEIEAGEPFKVLC